MSNKLSSLGALAYQGTNATNPPNVFIYYRAPTDKDFRNFSLGDFWIHRLSNTTNESNIYTLIGVAADVANWTLFGGSAGFIFSLTTDDDVVVVPTDGNINLHGAHGLNTTGAGSTATIAIDNAITLGDLSVITPGGPALTAETGSINITAGDINMPGYNTSGTQGVINIGGARFVTTDGVDNQFLGLDAGNLTMTGGNNTIYGAGSLRSGTTANNNLLIGNQIMTTATSGSEGNLVVGGGSYNIGTDSRNTIIGNGSLAVATTAFANTTLGYTCGIDSVSGLGLTTGDSNILIGYNAGNAFRGNESQNITIGNPGIVADTGVIRLGLSGTHVKNFQAGITGISPTGVSTSLPVLIDSNGQLGATGNIYLPSTNSAGTQGVIKFGPYDFISNYGIGNTFVGSQSGNTTLTLLSAVQNTGMGQSCLMNLTTGLNNSAYGNGAALSLESGENNTVMGGGGLQNAISSSDCATLGNRALEVLQTGSQNIAAGTLSGGLLLTGSNNIMLGFQSGYHYDNAESNNILIASQGTTGDNNTLRIGEGTGSGSYELEQVFVSGIRGVTTGVVDAIPVLIDSNGQLGTVSSSLRYKTNVRDLNGQSENIYKLRPVSFNYITHPDNEAWGLIAEEVEQVMPQLVVYNKDQQPETVKYQELPILLLNELQKLAKQNQSLVERIEILEKQLLKG